MNSDFGAKLSGEDIDVRGQSSMKIFDSHCGSGEERIPASHECRPAVGSRGRSPHRQTPLPGFFLLLVSAQMLFCAEPSTNNSASPLASTAPPDSPAAY